MTEPAPPAWRSLRGRCRRWGGGGARGSASRGRAAVRQSSARRAGDGPARRSPAAAWSPAPRRVAAARSRIGASAGAVASSEGTAFTTSGPSGRPQLAQRRGQLARLARRQLLRQRHDHQRRAHRIAEELVDGASVGGQRSLGHGGQDRARDAQHERRVAAGGAVEDGEVVARAAVHPLGGVPPGLAEDRIGVQPRDRVQEGADGAVLQQRAGDQLGAQGQDAVLAQRALGRHVDRVDPRRQGGHRRAERRPPKEVPQPVGGRRGGDQHPLAGVGGRARQRRRHRRAADAPFARDDDEASIEEGGEEWRSDGVEG